MNPFANLTGILMMVLVMVGLFYLAKGVFWLLAKAALFFLVGALLLHYPTVLGFGKWLWETLRRQFLLGVFFVALSVLLYPVLFAFLFFRALVNRKVSKLEESIRREQEGEFVDFEELESTIQARKRELADSRGTTDERYKDLFE
jgi:beta-xylosidase